MLSGQVRGRRSPVRNDLGCYVIHYGINRAFMAFTPDGGRGTPYRLTTQTVEKRTAEEKIHARLRELADDLRQLRREMKDHSDRKGSGPRALPRKPPPRNDPPPKG